MKRTIIFIVVLTFIFTFSYQLNAENQEGKKLFKKPEPLPGIQRVDPSAWETKREHLLQAKERKQQMMEKYEFERLPADNPNAVDIDLDASYTYWQNDGLGDVYMTALCYNAGTSYAAMVEAKVNFYDTNQNYLGYDTGYVYGGTRNVQYGTAGYCTNEIAPGEYGFFYVWPNVSYASAYYYSVSFTYSDSTTWPWANADLDFYGAVYYTNTGGNLEFYGDVGNYSYTYLTYYTEVHFAAFNTANTRCIDVDWDYVDGATYGTSSSAIYPRTYEPFDVWMLFAPYASSSGSYLNAFEWYEAAYGALPEADPPFGQFATPVDGANVASSIAVTGWALDDSGVDHVKIYRVDGSTNVYIGDATFVEGARPDVAALYPQYPYNTRAGWGYMLLTNFLPNGGNGTFVIRAIATDVVGKQTVLGTKTIHCDNAHAVKPFGAIDTPTQGGTASGASYVNWGWALTPQPNYIPTDGSTLNVYVDGVPLGHPNYNVYRGDIATLFPGYANSNGASGYFYLDTTAYADGVHTIYWTARDSAGNTDGIGSRYFSINNPRKAGSTMQQAKASAGKHTTMGNISQIMALPANFAEPVRVKKGFTADDQPMSLMPDAGGISRIEVCELGRIELHLTNPCAGYMIMSGKLTQLPVGSTLDLKKGIFSWIPCPAFLGEFKLVFVEQGPDGTLKRKNVTITIVPQRH
jgi:hypothetical protein